MIIFPVMMVWCEGMLRFFSGAGSAMPQTQVVLSALGAGCFCGAAVFFVSAVCGKAAGLRKRRGQEVNAERWSETGAFVCAGLISVVTALLFAAESVTRSVFTTYMSPGNLYSGAGNVLANYRGEFLRSLPSGVFRFFVFLLPALAYAAWKLKKRRAARKDGISADVRNTAEGQVGVGGERISGENREISEENPERSAAAAVLLVSAGILLAGCSTNIIKAGPDRELYGAQYSYNAAVDAFGLLKTERLDVTYGLFGLPEVSFSGGGTGSGGSGMTSGTGGAAGTSAPGRMEDGAASPSDAGNAAGAGTPSDAAAAEASPAEASYGKNVMEIDFSAEQLHATKQLAALTDYISAREPSSKNRYTGLFKGKNLILICAESYCDRFIRPELTPTLWRLTRNGIYFEEYYQSEWGGSTTTGELAFVEGLGGNDGDESMIKIAGNNHYFTMGNQLQRLGYSSVAFHNGSHTYYKRHTTHENLGYNQYIAGGSGVEKLTGSSYPDDTLFLELTPELYLDHQPFSVYYMTISGHAPYEKSSHLVKRYIDRVNEVLGSEYYDKTKYYICYQMELEEALRILVEKLEKAGIADETVIALTGDHYPYGLGNGRTWHNDRDYIDDLIKADDVLRWNQDRSGLILWCGSLEHEDREYACTVKEPVGNLDILPTLSNLFGVEFDSRLLPGRDALAPDTEPFVFWNNLTFVTKEGKYDSRKKIWYPNEGFEWTAEDPAYLERCQAMLNDRLLMSRSIQRTDYYGLLFGPDEVKQAGDILYTPEKAEEIRESWKQEKARLEAEQKETELREKEAKKAAEASAAAAEESRKAAEKAREEAGKASGSNSRRSGTAR